MSGIRNQGIQVYFYFYKDMMVPGLGETTILDLLKYFHFVGVRGALPQVYGHVCQGREVTAPEGGPLSEAFHLRFCASRDEHGQHGVMAKGGPL